MTDEAGLMGLFLSSFLASTLLPGGSELVLYALLAHRPQLLIPALAWATLGNTLGALSSYALGRALPASSLSERKEARWLRRLGSPVLLLGWVPLLGDGLCVAAGWLRLSLMPVTVFIAVGKFSRYWLVAQAAL